MKTYKVVYVTYSGKKKTLFVDADCQAEAQNLTVHSDRNFYMIDSIKKVRLEK